MQQELVSLYLVVCYILHNLGYFAGFSCRVFTDGFVLTPQNVSHPHSLLLNCLSQGFTTMLSAKAEGIYLKNIYLRSRPHKMDFTTFDSSAISCVIDS